MRTQIRWALTGMVLFLVIGCASGMKAGRPDNEDLKEAVKQYWTLRVQKDLGNAYEYEHVKYTGETPKDFYLGSFARKIITRDFEILKIGEEGSGPSGYTPVELKIKQSWPTATMPVPEVMEVTLRDLWVKKNGRWYHIIQNVAGYH